MTLSSKKAIVSQFYSMVCDVGNLTCKINMQLRELNVCWNMVYR